MVKDSLVYAHLTLYPIARYYKAKGEYSSLKIIGRLLTPIKIAAAVYKDKPILTSIIDKAFKTLSDAKIETILNNWTEVKIQKVIDYSLILKILLFIIFIILLGVWRYSVLKE